MENLNDVLYGMISIISVFFIVIAVFLSPKNFKGR